MSRLKVPYGTTTQLTTAVVQEREVVFDTTLDRLAYGDGSAAAGVPVAKLSEITTLPSTSNASAAEVTATGSTEGRSLADRFAETVSVLDYGADETGATSSAAAFSAAFTAAYALGKRRVHAPAGTYLIDSRVTVIDGVELFGDGVRATILTTNSATAGVLFIQTLSNGVVVRDLQITRSVAATHATAIGLESDLTGAGVVNVLVDNVWSQNHYYNFAFGPTSYSRARNLRSETAYSHGVVQRNSDTATTSQWYFDAVLTQKNAGDGFRVEAVTGVAQCILGDHHDVYTYANDGRGIAYLGLVGTPLQDVRLVGSFFGQDGASEVYLDTYGDVIAKISDVVVELCGTALTGRTLATAATNTGHGIECTANNGFVQISDPQCYKASKRGISVSCQHAIANPEVHDCGAYASGAADERVGIYVAAQSVINGGRIGNEASSNQQTGIYSTTGNVCWTGVDMTGNSSAPWSLTPDANTVVVGCKPSRQSILQNALGIGTSAAPVRQLDVEQDTAVTNTVGVLRRTTLTTSGTPAAGIGVAEEFRVETAAGNVEIGAQWEYVATDVTNASEDFDAVLKLMKAGAAATEALRVKSTGVIQVGAKDVPYVIARGGTALSHTGDTSETVLATVAIPAGAMGPNGYLEILALWTVTSSTNTKTSRIRLGGIGGTAFAFPQLTLTTQPTHQELRVIQNRNDAAVQIAFSGGGAGGLGTVNAAVTTGAVNTANAQDLVFTAQLGSAGDTITLERYIVKVCYGA